MIIDESKVNLLEKDIEDYIFQNPEDVVTTWGHITTWIKRQFQVPSGIIDLLGVTQGGALVVVEIKNVAIDASALTQVCRYAYDLDNIIGNLKTHHDNAENDFPEVIKVVVGRSIETKIMREAEALKIHVHRFSVKLTLDVNETYWKRDFIDERESRYDELRKDDELLSVIAEFDQSVDEYIEQYEQPESSEPAEDFDPESFFNKD